MTHDQELQRFRERFFYNHSDHPKREESMLAHLQEALTRAEERGRENAVNFIRGGYKWVGGPKPQILIELEELFEAARAENLNG